MYTVMRVFLHIVQGLLMGLALLGALWVAFAYIALDESMAAEDTLMSLSLVVFAVVGVGMSPKLWLTPPTASQQDPAPGQQHQPYPSTPSAQAPAPGQPYPGQQAAQPPSGPPAQGQQYPGQPGQPPPPQAGGRYA